MRALNYYHLKGDVVCESTREKMCGRIIKRTGLSQIRKLTQRILLAVFPYWEEEKFKNKKSDRTGRKRVVYYKASFGNRKGERNKRGIQVYAHKPCVYVCGRVCICTMSIRECAGVWRPLPYKRARMCVCDIDTGLPLLSSSYCARHLQTVRTSFSCRVHFSIKTKKTVLYILNFFCNCNFASSSVQSL